MSGMCFTVTADFIAGVGLGALLQATVTIALLPIFRSILP